MSTRSAGLQDAPWFSMPFELLAAIVPLLGQAPAQVREIATGLRLFLGRGHRG